MTRSLKNWDLQIDPGVLKYLKKTPRQHTEHLSSVIRLLSPDPYFGDIQKMNGEVNSGRRRAAHTEFFTKLKPPKKLFLYLDGNAVAQILIEQPFLLSAAKAKASAQRRF